LTDSELKSFYDEINNISSFSRIRKIYELTNNLDKYLLYHLKRDFTIYYICKIKDSLVEEGSLSIDDIEIIFGDILNHFDFENYLEGLESSLSSDFEQECLNNMYAEIRDFVYEIEDLEAYLDSSKEVVPNRVVVPFDFGEHEFNQDEYDYEHDELDKWFESQDKKQSEIQNEENIVEEETTLEEPFSISIAMKIIYLEKLGIIDFLKKEEPFNMSTNKMSNVISRVIGAKISSIQPYLNAIASKNLESKNNPLNSETNVEAVEYHLSKIGYKLRKKTD
jgi:hypothetical protein